MIELGQKPAKLHVFVCFNERISEVIKSSCGPKLDFEEFKRLKIDLFTEFKGEIKITKTSCLGPCPSKGFTTLFMPENKYYAFETLEELGKYIRKKFK